MDPKLTELKRISMKSDPRLNERWLHEKLVDKPELLGLGKLDLRERERTQPSGGRLDLLFSDESGETWYEVEVQLGAVDESHIIRTLEYWDIERLRYQNIQHIAVIVAEEITSRFFNIISLFNRFIPIVALQASAYEMGDDVALAFTKVLDHRVLELPDERAAPPTDRTYWESKASKQSLVFVDGILDILNAESELQQFRLNYNKFYIGLVDADSQAVTNVVFFRPRKKHVVLEIKCNQDLSVDERLDESTLDFEFHGKSRLYRGSVTDINQLDDEAQELFRHLLTRALNEYS